MFRRVFWRYVKIELREVFAWRVTYILYLRKGYYTYILEHFDFAKNLVTKLSKNNPDNEIELWKVNF